MTDCGCEKARRDLEEYLRSEVCKTAAPDISEHLEHCSDCRDEVLVFRTLTQVLIRSCKESLPEDLRDTVVARLNLRSTAR